MRVMRHIIHPDDFFRYLGKVVSFAVYIMAFIISNIVCINLVIRHTVAQTLFEQ